MRVAVQYRAELDAYDVWFATRLPDGPYDTHRVAHFTPNDFGPPTLQWSEYHREAATEPTLRLRAQEVTEFRRALDEHGPATTGAAEFTRDVIAVRNRLLTLVERLTERAP